MIEFFKFSFADRDSEWSINFFERRNDSSSISQDAFAQIAESGGMMDRAETGPAGSTRKTFIGAASSTTFDF